MFIRIAINFATLAFLGCFSIGAQGAITRVSFTGTNTNANLITIARPAGLVTGDVMLAQIAVRQSGAVITAPTGWTLVPGANPINNTNLRQAVYYKVATATEPTSYTWQFPAVLRAAGSITAYREVSTSNPIDVYGGQANASSTSVTAPSVTTTVANTMVVGFFGRTRGNNIVSPAGMTAGYGTGAGGATGIAVRSANVLQAAAGATGNKVANSGGAATSIGQLVALRPAPIPDPYLEYRMEEMLWNGTAGEVIDSSGFLRHGTAVGSAQTTATGRVCRGATIPNNTSAAAISAINSGIDMNTVGNEGGITFWYRLAETWGTSNRQLFDATVANNRWFFLTKRSNRQLRFTFADSTNNVRTIAYTASNYAANTWVHIGVSWSLSTNRFYLYINGAQVAAATLSTSGALNSAIGTLYIGDNRSGFVGSNGTGNSANGTIDEFRLYNSAITSSTAARDFALTRPCTTLNHIRLQHDGAGVTCAPESVTVRACVDAGCTTESTSPVTVTLAGSGWAVNPITFTGNTTASLSITTPQTVTLGTSAVTPTPSGTSPQCYVGATANCNLVFADSGFIFSNIPTQSAGVTSGAITVQAVRKSDNSAACVGVFTGNVAIDMASQCINPTTCAGKQVSINATPIANNPAAGIASYTPVTLNFGAASTASFTLNYADVGNMSLSARYALGGGSFMSGTSNLFVVKPFGFTVTGIQTTAGATPNPGAGSSAGPVFIKAGDAFTATVTAIAQGGAATPNFGKETSPEGVLLATNLVAPGGGANPALTGGVIAGGSLAAGIATPTNLSWDEVGILTLTPQVADGDYLGAGAVTGTTTGNIGRFYPHHFVAAGTLANRATAGCAPASTFTYMGEPMALALTFTAQNAGNTATSNYNTTGGFAKLDPATASWLAIGSNGSVGVGAVDGVNYFSPPASTRLALSGTPSGSWVAGIGSLNANVVLNRNMSLDGPFESLLLGVAPQDGDGVTVLAGALDLNADATAGNERKLIGSSRARYGRARLSNAHGSELLALPVPLAVQYYNGSGFITHADDNCTAFTLAPTVNNIPISYQYGDLLLDNPQPAAMLASVTATAPALPSPVSAGVSAITLAKPNPALSGSVDLTLNVPAWLEYNWTGVVGDPRARATFGVYKNKNEFIYQRESY